MGRERFIQGYAKLMARFGVPLTASRVFAHLLLHDRPLSLDQIAADLGISKASAWGATRHLEQVHQVDRFGEPGSKRALFAPAENFSRIMHSQSRMLSRQSDLMRDAAALAEGAEARARLLERADFMLAVHEAMEGAMALFMAERGREAAE